MPPHRRHKKRTHHKRRTYHKTGGHGPSPLSPGSYGDSVGTFGAVNAEANYAKMPNVFPSKQVGGMGYGFSSAANLVPNMAGSYFPITPMCAGNIDLARGGNNFMSGGKRSKLTGGILLGGRRKSKKLNGGILLGGRRRRTAKKRSTKKHSSTKKHKRKSQKKWWGVGCKKMKGGLVIV
jgi:hypothetical protein